MTYGTSLSLAALWLYAAALLTRKRQDHRGDSLQPLEHHAWRAHPRAVAGSGARSLGRFGDPQNALTEPFRVKWPGYGAKKARSG